MVYVMLANGFEEIEALTVVDLLRRAEIETKTVSIDDSRVAGSHGITVYADLLWHEINERKIDAIVLPGGMPGTKNLLNFAPLCELILKMHEKKKYLCAICAAPMILGQLGILNNMNVTCYPGFEKELKGAILSAGKAVSCENIITSRGAGTAVEFGLTIIAKLQSRELAEQIGDQIQLNKG